MRRRRLALAVLLVLALLGLLQQLALPPLAERRLRQDLERTARVERIDVRAVPGAELLWGRADRVEVVLGESRQGPRGLADQLSRTGATERLDARARVLRVGPLVLRDVRLTKRGAGLRSQATVTGRDLRAVLPAGFNVRPVTSVDGRLVLEGTARVAGRTVRAQVVLLAEGGRLLLAPAVPFGGLLAVPVFADPRIAVERVGARNGIDGFLLTGRARLVGED